MKTKNQSIVNRLPEPGDLVEIGIDHDTGKPYIGVVTEIREKSPGDGQIYGSVLVNEKVKWVDIYKLKTVKRKSEVHP